MHYRYHTKFDTQINTGSQYDLKTLQNNGDLNNNNYHSIAFLDVSIDQNSKQTNPRKSQYDLQAQIIDTIRDKPSGLSFDNSGSALKNIVEPQWAMEYNMIQLSNAVPNQPTGVGSSKPSNKALWIGLGVGLGVLDLCNSYDSMDSTPTNGAEKRAAEYLCRPSPTRMMITKRKE